MAEEKGNRFVKGAAILAASGLIVKVLGSLFRIPLNNWIGAVGMSYYSAAYNVYGVLLVLSTAGIPIAISRLVSEHIALKEYRDAHKIFRVATGLMAVVGAASFAVCFFGAGAIAHAIGNDGAAPALRAVSPALLLVPLFSSFRGYFNGRQNMNPTAISEITEQLVRVIAGLGLAWYLLRRGLKLAAAGAAFGATAGSMGGLLVIFLIFLLNRRTMQKKIDGGMQRTDTSKQIARDIIAVAVPIIIGSEIMPMMNLIDLSIIMRVLQKTGWSVEESKYLYGLLSGFCSPLIAFPQIMTQAVTVSLVPQLSRFFRVGKMDELRENIQLGYRTTMILAFPCAFGMMVLAAPILKLLYVSQWDACDDAAPTLILMAFGIIFLSIMQTSTSILQAVGKQNLPVRNLLIGVAGKAFITYFLVGIRPLNVKGAAIGTILAYIIAMALNFRDVKKYTDAKVDMSKTYLRPGVAAAIMAVFARLIYMGISAALSGHSPVGANILACGLAILAAIVIYAVLIFAVKAITVDELSAMPMGNKLEKIVRKFMPKSKD